MAGSLNKVMLIGNVGRDPEMRYTQSGEAVTTFSVATNRRWNGPDGQRHEETEWHNIVAWGKLAEQCNEYLTKGRTVYVEGRLQTRSWDDQASGQKRYRTEIIANTMQMLDQRDSRPREEGAEGMDGADTRGMEIRSIEGRGADARIADGRGTDGRGTNGRSMSGRGAGNRSAGNRSMDGRGGHDDADNVIDLDDTPF